MKKTAAIILSILALSFTVTACGSKEVPATSAPSKDIKVGVSPGPYGDMVKDAIAPYLATKGYTVKVVEFTDYVQPNQALSSGEIDANLMQHSVYLEKFSKDNNLDLAKVIIVPTAGMGIFSNTITSLNAIPDGTKVAIAADASNLARSLRLLKALGLVDFKADIDETKATSADIGVNPKNLEFVEIDAGQLSRSFDSVGIALVPGNFAIAAKLDFEKALAVEKLQENYKNVVAVRTEDLDSELGKDLKEAVESEIFKTAIENGIYKSFDKPEWYIAKYGK